MVEQVSEFILCISKKGGLDENTDFKRERAIYIFVQLKYIKKSKQIVLKLKQYYSTQTLNLSYMVMKSGNQVINCENITIIYKQMSRIYFGNMVS